METQTVLARARAYRPPSLYIVVLVDKVDVADATAVGGDEFLVTGGSFVAGIGGQHALQTHANALDVLHGRPTGRAEEIEADNAVAIDVGVDGNRAGCTGRGVAFDELDLWGFWWDGLLELWSRWRLRTPVDRVSAYQ